MFLFKNLDKFHLIIAKDPVYLFSGATVSIDAQKFKFK